LSESPDNNNAQPNSQPDVSILNPHGESPAAISINQSAASTDSEGEEPTLQAEAKDISNQTADGSVKIDHFITQEKGKDDANLSRKDLVLVLETFVNAVMDTKSKPGQTPHENLPSPLNFEPPKEDDAALLAVVEEKDAQINDLRTLLVEAQGTIIKLLTDRVEDKAKIATLEAHARYLPDFQRQEVPSSSQPAAVEEGTSAGELKEDLTKVKAELEVIQQTLKTSAYKSSFDKSSRWGTFKSWMANFINN
jgi:hypothetical protein